jgi:hypothetical protein
MQVAELQIENFRGIRTGRVRFGKHTVLVGPNNSGKTTIIEALALLFGRDRLVRPLTEHDFHGGDPAAVDRIRLIATIIGFANDDPAAHPDWFRDDRAIPKWWDKAAGRVFASRDQAEWSLACQIAFCARFDRADLEVETARYFYDDDEMGDVFVDEARVGVPTSLVRDIGFFLVPASRTWDRVVSFGSELFRRVVSTAGAQPAESVLAERDRLRHPEHPLEDDDRLAPIVEQLNGELEGFFTTAPRLRLRVTATDSEGLLDAVVPHYSHAGTAIPLPARRHGSGLVSLQHLLLLLQFGRQRAAADEGFWLALEEPELHVPPPLQRQLVHRIQGLSTQTVVSTHSPMVAAMSDPTSVIMLRNVEGVLAAETLMSDPLVVAAPNAIRKLFQLNRVDTISALMHDIVLVPEGRLDCEWLKLLARAVDLVQQWGGQNRCRFGSHIGVVPTHDAAVEGTVQALRSVHSVVVAIVDGDEDGLGYMARLRAQARPPNSILRWPDDWAIEDVVGWVVEGDAPAVLRGLAGSLVPEPQSVADLVRRLKTKERGDHGLKQDQVAYEAIAHAITEVEGSRNRASELLDAICTTIVTGESERFLADAENPGVFVFRP